MFVHASQPLGSARVRFTHQGGPEELCTDRDGQITQDLEPGTHRVQVRLNETWTDCAFDVAERQSLLVIDVGSASTSGGFDPVTGSFSSLSPQVFGDRYAFKEVLGRGGMGVVVKATDRLLNRLVAIKMLNDEFLDNQEAQQIFLEEARSIATLSHPNLVGIYDVTMLNGRAMIVFEHIDGEDLDVIFERGGRFEEGDVLRVAIQLTRALKYLHSQGILHRDIKPSNVLMQADGMLKIIDFGLARPLEQLAAKGTRVRGTPAYMAPEQIEGDQLTAATDIYQLGVSLYELLVGTLPFFAGNMAYAHVHMEAPSISEQLTLRDDRLANMIHACLHKAPSERPSAAVLFHSFQALYASHAEGYNASASAIVLNQSALFSETVELQVPERFHHPSESSGQRDQVTLDGPPPPMARHAISPSDNSLETSSKLSNRSLFAIAALLIALLLALGGVIMTLLQGEQGEPRSGDEKTVAIQSEPPPDERPREEEPASSPALIKPSPREPLPDEHPALEASAVVPSLDGPKDDLEGFKEAPKDDEVGDTATAPTSTTSPTKPVSPKTTKRAPKRVEREEPTPSSPDRGSNTKAQRGEIIPDQDKGEPDTDTNAEPASPDPAPSVSTSPDDPSTSDGAGQSDSPSAQQERETSRPPQVRKRVIRKVIKKEKPAEKKKAPETEDAPVSF